ncbi:MAG: hypothetical protein NZV14_07040 [Bryobacteraceae bacterium]|nr:hypothetical protein [Bryobacteraceae bacterium]MDW8377898.1 hypothetical protein [Bryobacterales bacterium]
MQQLQEIFERLVAAKIRLIPIPQIERHWVFERDGFISLVERTPDNGFGGIGSAGLWTEKGMAVLVLRGDRYYFVAKEFQQEASAEQVALLRKFASDLAAALKPDGR